MAVLTSAGMGGKGIVVVNGVVQGAGLVIQGVSGLRAWLESKRKVKRPSKL